MLSTGDSTFLFRYVGQSTCCQVRLNSAKLSSLRLLADGELKTLTVNLVSPASLRSLVFMLFIPSVSDLLVGRL